MNEQEFRELSAGHALGALSPDDERAFAAARAGNPEWSQIADHDAETAAALGAQLPAVAPPAMLRDQILGAIAQTPQASPSAPVRDRPSTPAAADHTPGSSPQLATQDEDDREDALDAAYSRRRKWQRGMFALVASVAVLSMIALGTSSLIHALSTPAEVTALQQIESAPDASQASTTFAGGVATVHWSEALGKTVLVAEGLPKLDEGREFELWFVRGETPLPAGTFTSSTGTGLALFGEKMQPGDLIAVTIEDAGGSPSGLPTTDPILAIETA